VSKFILQALGFVLATFPVLAQSTNPTGAVSQSTNPTGAVGGAPAMSAPAARPYITQHGPAAAVGPGGVAMPGGGIGNATPNSNGTTTITHPNGQVEVVNTPR
jgi:hypothetical protein